MILSNLLVTFKEKPVYLYKNSQTACCFIDNRRQNKVSIVKSNQSHIEQPLLLSALISNKNKSSTINLGKYDYASKLNFFDRLIHQYWQEMIVISNANLYVETKNNYMNGFVYSNEYKSLLLDFGKALLSSRISVDMNKNFHIDKSNTSIILKKQFNSRSNIQVFYTWRKGLNLCSLKDYFLILKDHIYKHKFTQATFTWMNQKENNLFPIFSIVNIFDEIIMAESPSYINSTLNWLDAMSTFIANHDSNQNKKYTVLFFISSKDASEYKEFIYQKYRDITDNTLKVFPSKLSVYYKLSRSKIRNTEFRLIPDLKEVSNLVKKYQYYNNISFLTSQIYGPDYFQGQPIYIIKPVIGIHKKTRQNELIYYSYNFAQNKCYSNYQAVFFNYNTAIHAWRKFQQQYNNYYLPNKPILEIFNLESLLKQQEDKSLRQEKLIFIPSYETYGFVKNTIEADSALNILQKAFNQFIYLKIISQRVLWSLTSRQPIKW